MVGGSSFVGSALFCNRPGPHERVPRTVIVIPIFLADAARLLRRSESRLWLTPELMEHGEVSKRKCDTERVRDLAGHRQRVFSGVQCVIRITQMPVAVCNVGMAEDAHVDAVDFGVVAAAEVARFQTSMKPIKGRLERTE